MHIKTLKVSFHHPHFLYKFKLQLNLVDNRNMFNIDPLSVRKQFMQIRKNLILKAEQSQMLQSFSLGFQQQFINKYEQIMRQRRVLDFMGETSLQHYNYFIKQFQHLQNPSVTTIKQLCIYTTNHKNLDHLRKYQFLQSIQKHFYGIITIFWDRYDRNAAKDRNRMFLFCECCLRLLHNIDFLLQSDQIKAKNVCLSLSRIVLYVFDQLFTHFSMNQLTQTIESCFRILEKCLQSSKSHSWIYQLTQPAQKNGISVLKFLLSHLSPRQNKNYIFAQMIVYFLHHTLAKCINVTDLLLFVTESINLRIILNLEEMYQKLKIGSYHSKDSSSLCLFDDFMEEKGLGVQRQVRVRQKKYAQGKWNKQLKKGFGAVVELREKFMEFKSGKIASKRQRSMSVVVKNEEERQRIRKQSFIMTNFEQVQRKYEEDLNLQNEKANLLTVPTVSVKARGQDHAYSQLAIKLYEDKIKEKEDENSKLIRDNNELIEINKWYEQENFNKDKQIKELENTISQFVDVRQKYLMKKILKLCSNCYEIKIKPTQKTLVQKSKQNFVTPLKSGNQKKEQLPIPILPPPPPPPPNFSSGRGSRGSKQIRNLPPPPPMPVIPSQFNLPPPPPPPPFTLPSPPPFTLSPPVLKQNKNQQPKRQKQIKMVNWTSVEISKVKDSFWESVDNQQFNEDQIFKYFGKKQTTQSAISTSQSYIQFRSLLKPDRAKNIQIVLKKTKIPFQQIPYAIQELDQNVLTPQNVQSLIQIYPQKQQYDEFIELQIDDPSKWTIADLFFCLISKINGYLEILTAVKFKFQFSYLYEEISEKLLNCKSYFENLRKDTFFQTFLSYMLSIGNYMNSDTNKGNAYGFRFESIEKTYNLMAQGNKICFFEYILQVMKKNQIQFPDKKYVNPSMIVPVQILRDDVREVTKLCGVVQEVLLMSNEEDTRTPQYFLSFYIQSRQKIQNLDCLFSETYKAFKQCQQFYCETINSESMIKVINEFKKRVLKYANSSKGKNQYRF